MKLNVVAIAFAFGSIAAYGADGLTSTNSGQQAVQTQSDQTPTTIPSDNRKPLGNNVKGVVTQGNGHVDPWSLLNQGWKQFEVPAMKYSGSQ